MNIKKIFIINSAKIVLSLWIVLLLGCESIPVISPQLASHSNSVRFESIYGPLTPKQSEEILNKLKSNNPETIIFGKHLSFEEEVSDHPLVIGNKVELLVDGPATYSSMTEAIENAKDHINIEIYNIDDDEVGRHFAELLINKQRSGVQVNIIYDSFGSMNTPEAFFKQLKESDINVLEYNPINPLVVSRGWNINRRDHRKLLIVDGRISFLGGINISSVYSSGSFGKSKSSKNNQPWRDTHLRITGPVVREFQKLFMSSWFEQKGETLVSKNYYPHLVSEGDEIVRAISSTPDKFYSQIHSILLSVIHNAKSTILLTNAYFVPDLHLLNALKDAAQRGVDVRLLLPEKTDSIIVSYAIRSYYDELLNAGVKIYTRQDALLHAKTVLVDGVWSTIGSTNFDRRSLRLNHELNAIIIGEDFCTQMNSLFNKDLKFSKLITLEEWRERSAGARLKEKMARLWAQWL
ncbi:cardiolipin synthase [Nitrosomonas sp. Nm166]|uniref:cardiolipin synthase n=1 Tax=Nitrosomonas sp. Nm166 TaxID=1881054 RepID=UPI0008DEB0A3|nr:cardiolipin synthase [Nitrosomonas sp. Nm166]SFF09167.1 cardiolipin synthase [Nitrosomonas sp. Nm166]